ncbi:hypothetical protein ASPBRDRAFT_39447 [Aspergillus brasiliensis CBS 101740]|uniref:Uncharacterized protein n=1 Tax=Aspergillus brasiliensis (strain CBS 101740 / IMI 381727 / IBT 21946) TaxID=767769 RepID=A0A1L9URK8_ASPBC|nr:hypothetical protein ASPBRDRAFT_39447 [Aspergillus brasiliensis CBS 101740]
MLGRRRRTTTTTTTTTTAHLSRNTSMGSSSGLPHLWSGFFEIPWCCHTHHLKFSLVEVWEAGWEGATLHPAIPRWTTPWNSIYQDNTLDQRWS